MKKLFALILALAMALSLVACGSNNTAETPAATEEPAAEEPAAETPAEEPAAEEPAAEEPAAAAGSVYYLNFKPESDEALQTVAALYTEKTGVPVKVVTAASGTYSQTLTAEMDKSAPPTLFVVGNANSVKDWSDYVIDLTDTPIANELNTDAYNLYDEDGKLVSIGYCFECYGIVVNPDNVIAAGHSMDELTSFEGLKAVAEDIHANADTLGFDAFSAPDMDDSSSWRYTGHLINLEYFYEEQASGAKWTECPPSLTGDYFDNYRNIYDLTINNSTTDPKDLATGGHDPKNEFIAGKSTFFLTGSWDYADIAETVPNATMIPYYAGVDGEENAGLNCGTENCWAINALASEEDQQATMDFLVWLVTDPEASRIAVDTFGAMPYKSAVESTNAFLAAADEYAAAGNYVMDWATNYQPNVDEYRAAAVSALNAYNADPTDANWELVRTAFIVGWADQYANLQG